MIRAKHIKELSIEGKNYTDVILIPAALLKSLLKYELPILKEPYNSLTDYGKGIVDTLKEQQSILSINLD